MKFRGLFILTSIACATVSVDAQPFKAKRMEKNIHKHISYLASDQLEGRGTGEPGEKLSADYIASFYAKYRLQPKGDNGSYFQTFEITTLRMAGEMSKLSIGPENMALFVDFYPLSISANKGSYKGNLVDIGYGIKDENRDDYKDKDVKGKAVLINTSLPGGNHPHSKFLAWAGLQLRVEEAVKQGAAVVVFYAGSTDTEAPVGELSTQITPSKIPVIFVRKELGILKSYELNLVVDILTETEKGHNVIGFKDNGAATTVVIGGHHDHLGRGGHGGSLSTEVGVIHNGADDNASGTAGILELARALKKGRKAKHNYLFMAFSGEEMGLLGSKHFVANPTYPLENISCMLNMDMIGKLDSTRKTLIINGIGTSPFWKGAIDKIPVHKNKIAAVNTTEGGIGASDHTSFYLAGIPSLHFFTGQHVYYHKPEDDVNLINFKGEVYVLEYMLDMIKLLNAEGKLPYAKTKDEDSKGRMKFAVSLGIMPDYVYGGEGLRVDGVKEGHPGALAGLQKDDIVIVMNGTPIATIKDYMGVLSSLKKGELVPLKVRRGSEIIDLIVQF